MITKVHTISMTAKNAENGAGCVPARKVKNKTAAVCIAPMMMFAQRFAPYLKTLDRSTMAIAVSIKIEKPNAAPVGMAAVDA
jgi:hypothetical protein